jgi:hypothetical protein
LSGGFFPLIDSIGPSFFIEDSMEYSLSQSVFELLNWPYFSARNVCLME